MELDVHLTREGEEPWGFEFIGGADCGIPLTIDKVYPSSPAEAAGLRPGDVVARLGDRLTAELTQEAANCIVAEAVGSLSFGICRGLYDPVLDDYEPIYEPIERADSDLRSEPTEVSFPIQQFGEPNDLSLDDPRILDPSLTDPSMFDSGYATRPLTETRSLTASPFIPNVKPYRPFSTEPLEVPPLDDPIILNPNYQDTFTSKNQADNINILDPEEEHLLRLIPLDKNVEPKFKLPISEKYDPDYDKKVKCVEGGKRETEHVEHELVCYADKVVDAASSEFKISQNVAVNNVHQLKKEAVKFDERMIYDNDIKSIEQTASEIVEESIERAVSVTEEIQKEVEVELRTSVTREMLVEDNDIISEIKTHMTGEESKVEKKGLHIVHDKMEVAEIKQEYQTEIKATEDDDILNEKLIEDQKFLEKRRLSTRKEIEDEIEIGTVKRISTGFEQEIGTALVETSNDKKNTTEQNYSTQQKLEEAIFEDTINRKSMAFETQNKVEHTKKASHAEAMTMEHNSDYKSSGAIKTETLKSDSKQKAFLIGLQTIPHIKGFVQSSYHFDLLLRTFFVHLTDVMVALSRFIITQPTTELESKSERVINEKLIKELSTKDSEQSKKFEMTQQIQKEKTQQSVDEIIHEKKNVQDEQETKSKSEVSKDIHQVQQVNHDINASQNNTTQKKETQEIIVDDVERKKKSGAEMAQMTERKSKDLTKKMDAVITEFETKSGIEERLEISEQRLRRSRSKSQIEEEVMKENDPLEWLDKVDSRRISQERTDVTTLKKESSLLLESKESKKSEIKCESRSTTVKPAKQMYVAIVESHVYTNKDAIIEEQVTEMSETASVQSSEELNAALESFEVTSTENVAISNVNPTEEKQQAVEIITNALEEVVQEHQEILESVKGFQSRTTEQHSNSVMQESHNSVAAESTELVDELKVEVSEVKSAATAFMSVALEATKEVTVDSKVNRHEAVAKQELLSSVVAEEIEIVTDESKLNIFEVQQSVAKTAAISSKENYKATAVNTTETFSESTQEGMTEFRMNMQQAVPKVESLAIAVAESTDVVVDDSKVESFECKELISKKAKIASEDTFKTAAIESTEVALEMAEEKHSERALTSHVTIREETGALAVAGIIETKVEICKEPKKPAEDEYASLKIVKEEVIDVGESIKQSSESEINVRKSLEVEMSSTQHIHSSSSQSHKSYQSISQEISSSDQENYSSSSQSSKLHLRTDLAQQRLEIVGECDENNNTPSPSTDPPTPLTDEYVFKLEIPLPKNQGTVVIEESPDREDPHIVKKGLVPHIETMIEEQIIYDPPLPTPPEDKVQSPVYTKPGLRGGATPLFRKEYIREIERKSSLLASAIDETIKSIEEYKEEVGIDKKSVKFDHKTAKSNERDQTHITNGFEHTNGVSNGHSETESDKENEEWVKVEKQMIENNESIKELSKEANAEMNGDSKEGQEDVLPGFKPVVFNPEAYHAKLYEEVIRDPPCAEVSKQAKMYVNEAGEPLGTVQGIVDGLQEAVVDEEVAKELGKPGLTEDKIAVLISGESEMLREAHVMGLSRVLTSHMTRTDDSSVDFQKIKPLVESLKDSEVLKALNEELLREMSQKKKKEAEKKWTTFLQKPKRPVPRAKCGYYGHVEQDEIEEEEPYKVKIVKQPKPKVAPDYKPEDFETGPLPWEQRALTEPVPSPIPPEDPILVPEETPEFLEAIDPLPESEVPDLEDTGIPLPPTPPPPPPEEPLPPPDLPEEIPPEQPPEPEVEEPPKMPGEMDQSKMAEQLVNSVRSMVDPQASLEQRLSQMRAQLAALAQLPCVIQQSLEMLTQQLAAMSHQESQQTSYEEEMKMERHEDVQVRETTMGPIQEYNEPENVQNHPKATQNGGVQNGVEHIVPENPTLVVEEYVAMKKLQEAAVEEQIRSEKEKKEQLEKARLDHESRQIKQRAAPRVGKPKPVFGPLNPEERPLVLPGGRRWRGPKDAYNEQMIAETLQAQSEILQGKVLGYESDILPYDERINFMKYEKPPVNLEHLQNSATYKLVHNMEQEPLRKVELLTPVVSEADYRERCRSATPSVHTNGRM